MVTNFTYLFSDISARGPISIPTPPMMTLTEFPQIDAETNVYPLHVSWYFISSSLWWHQIACTHIMSMLWSFADAVSTGSWPILFILTLNVAIFIVLLQLSNFCFCLSFRSAADFSNTGTRTRTSAERTPFFFYLCKRRYGLDMWIEWDSW